MEFKNQVLISGRAYRPKLMHTKSGKPITTFGLSVYNGKDRDGKPTYCFMDCKCFTDESSLAGDVLVKGRIGFDCWEKEGKKFTKPVIIVDKIMSGDSPVEEQSQEIVDDDIPF